MTKPLLASWFALLILLSCVIPGAASAPDRSARVVIITGNDYPGHLWKETTPVLAKALRGDARLDVAVQEDPGFLASSRLHDYDVVVLHYMNWESPDPGPEALDNFRRFVASGRGLVLVHFACGAFQSWAEFRNLAGRSWDPKLRGHDPRGAFRVRIADKDHPITRGLEDFETDDELYTCLAGDRPIRILAAARSRVDDKEYPMAFVCSYEKGRVFHCVLGHDVKALSVPAVQELYRRGCAWAAGLAPVPSVTAVSAQAGAGSARMTIDDLGVRVHDGPRLVLEYRVANVPFKPYVSQLLTPKGLNVLRDAPEDHLHHHALMFAIAADGVDFWSETQQNGRQLHRSFGSNRATALDGLGIVSFTEDLDWLDPANQLILAEKRTIEAYTGESLPASLVTWRSELRAPAGRESVKLTGSHYFGLGARFLASMDRTGRWIYPEKRSDPVVVRGDERLVRSTWCAYTAQAGEKPVTFAMFDSPRNPRHPAHWFTMKEPFAYLSATLNLWKEPLTVPAGQPLSVCYGVAVWDGAAEAEDIDRLYSRWVELAASEAKE